jgi:hypothetical protein
LASTQHKRKVSNYLLNKSLQLRYVALVTAMSAIISGTLGFLIWRQEKYASEKVLESFDSSELAAYPELKTAIVSELSSRDTGLVTMMTLAFIGLVVVLSLYLVVMTHKVAGPLYKVGLYFDKMAAGRLDQVWPLRKGDMLVDFYETFRAAHQALRKRHQDSNAAIGRFLAACDSAGVGGGGALGHELDELRAHHKKREEALA